MNLKKFDPFNNRLARDIRNTLSKSFLESLAEKDASIFHKRAAEYLKQDLEQVYQEYVKTRLDKFDDVFAVTSRVSHNWEFNPNTQHLNMEKNYLIFLQSLLNYLI